MQPQSRRVAVRRRWPRLVVLAPVALLLTGCSAGPLTRFGFRAPVTVQAHRILNLWVNSVWAALVVGGIVYALILYACFRFRMRGDRLPRQVHYNVPVEVLYTVLPFVIVSVLFYFTARDEYKLDALSTNPDLTVGVVGFQWSWQFNYPQQRLQVTGRPGQYPVLYLPAHKRVQFVESSPDVIHSFWVPDFLFKRDVIPGRLNRFEVTTEDIGTFAGRCTELCGVYHDRMLFTVKIVSPADFDRFVSTAKAQAEAGTSDVYSVMSGPATTTNPSGSNS